MGFDLNMISVILLTNYIMIFVIYYHYRALDTKIHWLNLIKFRTNEKNFSLDTLK